MKKAIKTLVTILEAHRKGENISLNKGAKAVFLVCPDHFAPLTAEPESLAVVENPGAALCGAEASLDCKIREQKLPLLVIVADQSCADIDFSEEETDASADVSQLTKAQILAHLDKQVAAALNRYGDLIKKRQLTVAGIYRDAEGRAFIANYNGLRGKGALSYSLPDVDEDFFLK